MKLQLLEDCYKLITLIESMKLQVRFQRILKYMGGIEIKPINRDSCLDGPEGIFSFKNFENNAQLIANAPKYLSYLLRKHDDKCQRLKQAKEENAELRKLIQDANTVEANRTSI